MGPVSLNNSDKNPVFLKQFFIRMQPVRAFYCYANNSNAHFLSCHFWGLIIGSNITLHLHALWMLEVYTMYKVQASDLFSLPSPQNVELKSMPSQVLLSTPGLKLPPNLPLPLHYWKCQVHFNFIAFYNN